MLLLEKGSAALDQKFVSLVREAEKSKDMAIKIAEANALKRKSEEEVDKKQTVKETVKVSEAKIFPDPAPRKIL